MHIKDIIKNNKIIKRAIRDIDEEREETMKMLVEPCAICKTGEDKTDRCMVCQSNYYEGFNKKTYPDWRK